jgi:hypothetical protein
MKVVAGLVIVAVHVAGFAWLAGHSRGHELAIDAPPLIAETGGPGLVHRTWSESFRGGHTRTVSTTQLAGPFQDPAAPACSGRIVVGQALLDQIRDVMATQIDRELRGMSVFPAGGYRRVVALALRWAKDHVLVQATLQFDRVDVPVTVKLYPERTGNSLTFRIAARAHLELGNRVLQWVSDKVHADAIATRIAREEIDDVLVTTFAPPPPFQLADGQTLQFTYCDGPVEIVENQYGALPFAVVIGRVGDVLPPRFATGSRPTPGAGTTLALDLDVDALDALLFELWRTGWLDKRLAEVGLDRRFNTDPTVTRYLSVRISALRLALPPVIAPDGAALSLAADARVAIADGAFTTVGRVYGTLAMRFGTTLDQLAVDVGALDLTCERGTQLVPCYGDLVAALRDRGNEFHGALTDAFARLISDIFAERSIGTAGLPAEIVIERAVPSLAAGGTLHLDLTAKVAPRP